MCASGKVKYLESGAANLTQNTEYDIVAFASNTANDAVAIVVDDNGDVYATGPLDGAAFTVTSLTASVKVI